MDIKTRGDGNCAFNAVALGIGQLINQALNTRHQADEARKLKTLIRWLAKLPLFDDDDIRRNDDDNLCEDLLKAWVNSNFNCDNESLQKNLAPHLRRAAIEYIESSYDDDDDGDATYKDDYEQQLQVALERYIEKPEDKDDNGLLYHDFISDCFEECSQRYREAVEKDGENAPELNRSALLDNEKRQVLEWWRRKGKDQYFKAMKEPAQDATQQALWGGIQELSALAQLLDLEIHWQGCNMESPKALGHRYGQVNLRREELTSEVLRDLVSRGILGKQCNQFIILLERSSLQKQSRPLSDKKNRYLEQCIRQSDNNINFPASIDTMDDDDFNAYRDFLFNRRILSRIKVENQDIYRWISTQAGDIDIDRIHQLQQGISDPIVSILTDCYRPLSPGFTVRHTVNHWIAMDHQDKNKNKDKDKGEDKNENENKDEDKDKNKNENENKDEVKNKDEDENENKDEVKNKDEDETWVEYFKDEACFERLKRKFLLDSRIAQYEKAYSFRAHSGYDFFSMYGLMEAGIILAYYRGCYLGRCDDLQRLKDNAWLLSVNPLKTSEDKIFEHGYYLITWPPLFFNKTIVEKDKTLFDMRAAVDNGISVNHTLDHDAPPSPDFPHPLSSVLHRETAMTVKGTFLHRLKQCISQRKFNRYEVVLPLYFNAEQKDNLKNSTGAACLVRFVMDLSVKLTLSIKTHTYLIIGYDKNDDNIKNTIDELRDQLADAVVAAIQGEVKVDKKKTNYSLPRHDHKPAIWLTSAFLQQLTTSLFKIPPSIEDMKKDSVEIERHHISLLDRFTKTVDMYTDFFRDNEKVLDFWKGYNQHCLHDLLSSNASFRAEKEDEDSINKLIESVRDYSRETVVMGKLTNTAMRALHESLSKDKHSCAQDTNSLLSELKKAGENHTHAWHTLIINQRLSELRRCYSDFEASFFPSSTLSDYTEFFPSKTLSNGTKIKKVERNSNVTTLYLCGINFNYPLTNTYKVFGGENIGWLERSEEDSSLCRTSRGVRSKISRIYKNIKNINTFIQGFTYLQALHFTGNIFKSSKTIDGRYVNGNTYVDRSIKKERNFYFSEAVRHCFHLQVLETDVCPSRKALLDLHAYKRALGLSGIKALTIYGDIREYCAKEGLEVLSSILAPGAAVYFDGQKSKILAAEWGMALLVVLREKAVTSLTLVNHPRLLRKRNNRCQDHEFIRLLARQLTTNWPLHHLELRNVGLTDEALHALATPLRFNLSLESLTLGNKTDEKNQWEVSTVGYLIESIETHPWLKKLELVFTEKAINYQFFDIVKKAVELMQKRYDNLPSSLGCLLIFLGKLRWDESKVYWEDKPVPFSDKQYADAIKIVQQYHEKHGTYKDKLKEKHELKKKDELKDAELKEAELNLSLYYETLCHDDMAKSLSKKSHQLSARGWRLALNWGLGGLLASTLVISNLLFGLITFGHGILPALLTSIVLYIKAHSLLLGLTGTVATLANAVTTNLISTCTYNGIKEAFQLFLKNVIADALPHAASGADGRAIGDIRKMGDVLRETFKKHQGRLANLKDPVERQRNFVEIVRVATAEMPPAGGKPAQDQPAPVVDPPTEGKPDQNQEAGNKPDNALQGQMTTCDKKSSERLLELLEEGNYLWLQLCLGEGLYRNLLGGNSELFLLSRVKEDKDSAFKQRLGFIQLREQLLKGKLSDQWRVSDSHIFRQAPEALLMTFWKQTDAAEKILEIIFNLCKNIVRDNIEGCGELAYDMSQYSVSIRDDKAPYKWEGKVQCLCYFLMASLWSLGKLDKQEEWVKMRRSLDSLWPQLVNKKCFTPEKLERYSGLRSLLRDILSSLASISWLVSKDDEEDGETFEEDGETLPSQDEKAQTQNGGAQADNNNNVAMPPVKNPHLGEFKKMLDTSALAKKLRTLALQRTVMRVDQMLPLPSGLSITKLNKVAISLGENGKIISMLRAGRMVGYWTKKRSRTPELAYANQNRRMLYLKHFCGDNEHRSCLLALNIVLEEASANTKNKEVNKSGWLLNGYLFDWTYSLRFNPNEWMEKHYRKAARKVIEGGALFIKGAGESIGGGTKKNSNKPKESIKQETFNKR